MFNNGALIHFCARYCSIYMFQEHFFRQNTLTIIHRFSWFHCTCFCAISRQNSLVKRGPGTYFCTRSLLSRTCSQWRRRPPHSVACRHSPGRSSHSPRSTLKHSQHRVSCLFNVYSPQEPKHARLLHFVSLYSTKFYTHSIAITAYSKLTVDATSARDPNPVM
jgi:hypothetical protein